MSDPGQTTPAGASRHDAPMPARRIALIVNPSAGGGHAADVLGNVERRLGELGLPHQTHPTDSLAHGGDLARAAVERGEIPVVLSGDGLVGAVAAALSRVPGATMGVLPGGRGNDFARVVGIPRDAVEACDTIASGEVRAFDLGEVNGVPFIGIASLGFDSDANRMANEAPRWLGAGAYAYAALRALASWKHARFTVDVDGDRRSFSGWSVVAANSKAYGGGMFIAPNADLHDGQIDVILTTEGSRLEFVRTLPKVFKGTHVAEDAVHELRGRTVRISADRPFTVYADGDPIAELPVTVRTLPAAIRILVPGEHAPGAS